MDEHCLLRETGVIPSIDFLDQFGWCLSLRRTRRPPFPPLEMVEFVGSYFSFPEVPVEDEYTDALSTATPRFSLSKARDWVELPVPFSPDLLECVTGAECFKFDHRPS